jgi:hypothetical protein
VREEQAPQHLQVIDAFHYKLVVAPLSRPPPTSPPAARTEYDTQKAEAANTA